MCPHWPTPVVIARAVTLKWRLSTTTHTSQEPVPCCGVTLASAWRHVGAQKTNPAPPGPPSPPYHSPEEPNEQPGIGPSALTRAPRVQLHYPKTARESPPPPYD